MSLKKLIKNLKAESRPEKKYKKALWQHLDHKFDHMYPAARRTVPRYALVAAVVVFVLLGVGSGAYAYDSPGVIEGHPLHFIKENIENLEGKIKFSPEKKAEWHLKMQERRLQEAEYYARKKNEFRKQLLERGINEMGLSLEEMQRISEKEQRQLMLQHLSDMEKAQIEMLQKIKPQLSQYSQQVIEQMIAEQTRRMHERVGMLAEEDQKPFEPIRMRRFRILPAGMPPIEIESSSGTIITAEMLPPGNGDMQIRLISY